MISIMRAVVQRVKKANVSADNNVISEIGRGLLVLLAIHQDDKDAVIQKLADKIINMRIFSDRGGKMNLSVKEVGGEILVVSQFTLYADTNKGNRPGFTQSAKPDKAIPFYEKFVSYIRDQGLNVSTGEFGAMMEVKLTNDGPVTIIVEM
jgi:D-tyrosyl-tRNA(Tyr) deacylase